LGEATYHDGKMLKRWEWRWRAVICLLLTYLGFTPLVAPPNKFACNGKSTYIALLPFCFSFFCSTLRIPNFYK
jgi:hypothetical protein